MRRLRRPLDDVPEMAEPAELEASPDAAPARSSSDELFGREMGAGSGPSDARVLARLAGSSPAARKAGIENLSARMGNRQLTRMIGLHDVVAAPTQVLARDAVKKGARPKPKYRDVRSMSEDELRQESERNFAERERKGVSDERWQELFERSMDISDESERRSKEAELKERAKEAQADASKLVASARQTSKDLKAEIEFANEKLDDVERDLKTYLEYYNLAYGRFSGALEKAKRAAEEQRSRDQVIAGILVGTGLGLAAGVIFQAAKGAAKVVAEAATEAAEALVGKAGEAAAPSRDVFKPPAGFDPKLIATPIGDQLMDAWRGLAKFNVTTHAFGEYQLSVQQLAFELERNPTEETIRNLRAMLANDRLEAFRREIKVVHQGVAEFKATSRHPNLIRNSRELEQDMWIRWLSALPGDVDERQEAIAAVRRDLYVAGVIGERTTRLGVDWGRVTTGHDYEDTHKGAIREGGHMDQIGRYAVADNDFASVGGVVTVRDDDYLWGKLGKKPPKREGLELIHKQYPATSWKADDKIKGWQIVRVMGTTSKGLEVEPAKDQNGKPAFV